MSKKRILTQKSPFVKWFIIRSLTYQWVLIWWRFIIDLEEVIVPLTLAEIVA